MLFNRATPDYVSDEEIERILAEEEAAIALDILFATVNNGEEHEEDENSQEAIPEHEELLNNLVGSMQSIHGFNFMWNISGINCSAHSLQLGVHDSIKVMPKSHQNIIKLCSSVAKHLRLKSTWHELNADQIKYSLPRLEVITRWSSTFLMVSV